MSFDNFPRDVQLLIISKLDIDGRIKCGIVGRLSPPSNFLSHLKKVCAFKIYLCYSDFYYRELDRVMPRPWATPEYKGWYLPHEPWLTCTNLFGVQRPEAFIEKWYTIERNNLMQCEIGLFKKYPFLRDI